MTQQNRRREGAFDVPDLTSLPPDGGKEFNRLVFTSSPYLLQHARNPVDWYPWDDEAFAKAREEDKPIFLSIGYSTCHWCHVMEHESFESDEVAAFLNEHFVSIKVDREERPDVDHIYMTVCQAMTGSGGWPLTIFMSPDKKPFFAGTYFPPGDRFGRPGFLRVLRALSEAWRDERAKLTGMADELQSKLTEAMTVTDGELPPDVLTRTVETFKSNYDSVFGGFGPEPKFPMGHTLSFLLRRATAEDDTDLLHMVEHTLMRMYRGGIWDHLGGGFCRYSVDRKWLVPHFEKMLYDNALLLMAYTDAFQVTNSAAFRSIAMDIVDYVRRDMTRDDGAFYSAENADSEGVEGKFYVFTKKEFEDIIGEHTDILAEYFGVQEAGNFEQGQNILHIAVDPMEWAQRHGLELDEMYALVSDAKKKLFEARARRMHPSLDDKVLTSWNGLMIAALAQAGQAFDRPELIDMARRAADTLLEHMRDADAGTLLRRLRGEDAGIDGFLEDYAFFTWGLIDLYQATFETRYLAEAVALTGEMLERFGDEKHGALYFTTGDTEELIVRTVESHDGALPSGNSAAAYNLMRLARMTGHEEWEQRAEHIMRAFAGQLERYPAGSTVMLTALDFARGEGREIVLAGKDATAVAPLASAVRKRWTPRSVLLFHSEQNSAALRELAPYVEHNTAVDGKPTAWVCRNFACEMPVHSAEELGEKLGE